MCIERVVGKGHALPTRRRGPAGTSTNTHLPPSELSPDHGRWQLLVPDAAGDKGDGVGCRSRGACVVVSQPTLCGYRRCMPTRTPPTAQDAATARRILLDRVANGVDLGEILGQLAPLHPRNNTFPGEVFLRLAADALDWASIDRADPVDLDVVRQRFLPEVALAGRDRRKLQYAVLAAAAAHGGVEVDLLDEVAWWQTDDFWRYATYTAVIYIRVAADRAGVPASDVCRALAQEQAPPPG